MSRKGRKTRKQGDKAEVKNANNINFIVVRFFIALKSKKLEIQFFIKADLAFFLKRQEL